MSMHNSVKTTFISDPGGSGSQKSRTVTTATMGGDDLWVPVSMRNSSMTTYISDLGDSGSQKRRTVPTATMAEMTRRCQCACVLVSYM